jgi:alpha-ketoglutaric semialdehyde dehydrogenase
VHGNYIANAWVNSSTGRTFEDENPALKGSSLGRFQDSCSDDVRRAVDAAAEAYPRWSRTALAERQACAARFIDMLRRSKEQLSRIVCQENGKTLAEARAELDSACAEGDYHVNQASRLCGHGVPMGTEGYLGWSQYQALGAVGIVSPWNFP